jgi:hypothetical protein
MSLRSTISTGAKRLIQPIVAASSAWQIAGSASFRQDAARGVSTAAPDGTQSSSSRADEYTSRNGTEEQRTGYRRGQRSPLLHTFDLSPTQACERFEAWQRSSSILAPRGLLSAKGVNAPKAELLPFWCFDATLEVQHRGKLWHKTGKGET